MKHPLPVFVAFVATVSFGGMMSHSQAPAARTPSASAGAPAWSAPRTAWGDPDLQGIWSSGYIETPMERPDRFSGREFMTDDEVAAEQKRLDDRQDHSTGGPLRIKDAAGDTGSYNTVFSGRGREVIRTRRTSFVIDPPDGKIPWRPELKAKLGEELKMSRSGAGSTIKEDNDRGGDGPEDRPNDRCRGFALPHQFGNIEAGGAHHRIVQAAGRVSLYYEYGPHGGAYRTIPLDGRPHLPATVRQWLGDPVGRWDGETLVVDTTNFTDQTNFQGSRGNLHLVERFTRTAPDLILYRATIEDSTVFTRPWTIEVPLTKKDDKANQIFESACHEGNYGMTGILAGARAFEKASAAKPAPASTRAPATPAPSAPSTPKTSTATRPTTK
jgi:hypothetical protein